MTLPGVGSIVLVRWEDAHEQARAKGMPDPTIVETIGWLAAKDRRAVAVAAERLPPDADERWRGVTRIPRGMILDVTRICSGS